MSTDTILLWFAIGIQTVALYFGTKAYHRVRRLEKEMDILRNTLGKKMTTIWRRLEEERYDREN